MKVCVVAAVLWFASSEREVDDGELYMLQTKTSSSMSTSSAGLGTDEWSICNKKVTSSLGGYHGADVDELGYPMEGPQGTEMRYHKVGNVNGVLADLRLTTIGEYTPHDASKNGRAGCMGQINVASGTQVHVQFSLVKSGTNDIIPASANLKQNFTVVDFDRSKEKSHGHTIEEVWAKGFGNIDDTRVPIARQEGEWYVFQAPEDAFEIENPDDLSMDDLTEEQVDSTLSLSYGSTNTWEIIFKAVTEGEGNGRNFLWAGETSSCDVTPECMCSPDDSLQNPSKLDHYLKWDMCGADEPIRGNGHVLRYPKVGKMSAGDGTMKVGERYVDLLIDNMTAYKLVNPENNGRHGCLGQLNVAAPGDVTMRFTIAYAGTDEPIPVDPTFPLTYDFNVFDFDASASGRMQEVIGVGDFSRLVARPPGITKVQDKKTGIWWLRTTTKAVENPVTDIRGNLTTEQIMSSFSVSYRAVSSWDIHFRTELKESDRFRPGKANGARNFLFSGESCASWRFHECRCPKSKKRYGRKKSKGKKGRR